MTERDRPHDTTRDSIRNHSFPFGLVSTSVTRCNWTHNTIVESAVGKVDEVTAASREREERKENDCSDWLSDCLAERMSVSDAMTIPVHTTRYNHFLPGKLGPHTTAEPSGDRVEHCKCSPPVSLLVVSIQFRGGRFDRPKSPRCLYARVHVLTR